MEYKKIIPLSSNIKADRQGAKRHYGVHPYFTRRPHNVVRAHILHFTNTNDVVLDPFGGSGVTAIEAMLSNRIGIQNDINPLANFISDGIANLRFVSSTDLKYCFEKVLAEYSLTVQLDKDTLWEHVREYLPDNVELPKTADVRSYRELFTERQLIELALLRKCIESESTGLIKNTLLLVWSATLSKINKTFISTTGRAASRGGSSIFSIYRYKIAKEPVELDTKNIFFERFFNVLDAKKEIDQVIEFQSQSISGFAGDYKSFNSDVTELPSILGKSVDYIFTDPPYGAHIAYLDLSTLWNVWLNHQTSDESKLKEIIVGGSFNFSDEHYIDRLAKSINVCCSILKKDRWMSVVFQHSDPRYFAAILDAATESGAEFRSAISQVGDVVWSMHKKKNRESVLGGEFILTFFNSGKARAKKRNNAFDQHDWVRDAITSSNSEIYAESILNQLILEAWNNGQLHSLTLTKEELNDLLREHGFEYDSMRHSWRHHVVPPVYQETLL